MADPELTKVFLFTVYMSFYITFQAFTEHQAKMLETNAQVTRLKQQMDDLKLSIKSSQITDKEISSLPAGTRLYESVGRL